jgi:HK97 family phage major capsid protein
MGSLELNVPGLSGSATAAMFAENTEITASDLTLTSRKLTAKKLGAVVVASNEILADSNPALRNLVAMDLIKTMAQELDRQLLEGAGAGSDLTGIRRWVGPTNTVLGSGSGAVITLDNIAAAISRMKIANANPGAILMHPRTEAQVRLLKDGDGHYIWQPSVASDGPARLFGIPIFVSSQISITENVGGATKSWLAVVDPTQLVIGRRLDVAVFYDPYSKSSFDQVLVRATARFDFAVLNSAGVEIVSALSA